MTSRLLRFIALVFVMAAIGAAIALISHRVDTLAIQLDESRADRASLRVEVNEQNKAAAKHLEQMEALAGQVEHLGGKPVVDPADPTAPPRALGPTNAQVLAAVKVICGGTSICSPSREQVKVALAQICGDCRGEDGTDAKTPADGRDGADGEDAPAVTDAQIDAAVARNCGEDGCRGPGPTDEQMDNRIAAYCAERNDCRGKDAVIVPSGMDCPEGERVNGVHLLADGSLTVSCAPLIGEG
jgi:hypothetical protein